MSSDEPKKEPDGAQARAAPARLIAVIGFVILSASAGVYALSQGWLSPAVLQRAVTESGPAGMAVFVLAVAALELLWMPRSWGLIAGGVLFGPLWGAVLTFLADTLGALICYLIGRGGGRRWVEAILSRRPKAQRVVRLIAKKRGAVAIAILRIVPVAHYTAVSYAAGLSGVPLGGYLLGNSLGLLPFAILFPFVGDAALEPTSPAFLIGLAIFVAVAVLSGVLSKRLFKDEDDD